MSSGSSPTTVGNSRCMTTAAFGSRFDGSYLMSSGSFNVVLHC